MRFKPIYRIVIGSSEIDVTKDVSASAVVRVDVERAIEMLVDTCELRLAPLGGARPALDDSLTIELGFDDKLTRVFTGTVAQVIPEITAVRVTGLGATRALTAKRLGKAYTGQAAGAIVRDLASQANVKTGTIEDGISFPAYAADGNISLARNISRLAERCGFDAYMLPTGELEFRRFTGAVVHVFTFAQDILDISLTTRPERASDVVVFGDSPAGDQGDDAVSWLTKGFKKGQATGGRGSESLLVLDPAIRTTIGANTRAEGVLRRSRQLAKVGRLRALGRPEIALGDGLRIEQAPDDRMNDTFQARAIRHRLSRRLGLVTDIDFWGMP
jgi:phage protein D